MKLTPVLNLVRTLSLASSGFINLAEVTPACEVTNDKPVPIVRNYNLIKDRPLLPTICATSSKILSDSLGKICKMPQEAHSRSVQSDAILLENCVAVGRNDQPHPELTPKVTNEQFDNLIRDLGATAFAVREKASNTLKARLQDCPISHLETFIKRLQEVNPDLEITRRTGLLLRPSLFNERLRNIKNDNEKLEYIGTLVRGGVFNPIDYKEILLSNLDKLSNEIIRLLAQHGDGDIKWEIAANPNTPGDTLTKLSQDQEPLVRYRVAKNLNTPGDTLTILSQDQDPCVRCGVAANPNTPGDTLTKLSQDQNETVRYRVAENPKTPKDTLTKLSQDQSKDVRGKAQANLDRRISK